MYCNSRHRHLAQGQSIPSHKSSKAAGGLRPRLRTPDAWVVMPWRWGHIRELVAEPSQRGLLARPLSIGLSVETQLSWVRMQTSNPKQTLLGSTPKGPKPQPHWVRPRTHPPTLLAYDNKGPTPKPGAWVAPMCKGRPERHLALGTPKCHLALWSWQKARLAMLECHLALQHNRAPPGTWEAPMWKADPNATWRMGLGKQPDWLWQPNRHVAQGQTKCHMALPIFIIILLLIIKKSIIYTTIDNIFNIHTINYK